MQFAKENGMKFVLGWYEFDFIKNWNFALEVNIKNTDRWDRSMSKLHTRLPFSLPLNFLKQNFKLTMNNKKNNHKNWLSLIINNYLYGNILQNFPRDTTPVQFSDLLDWRPTIGNRETNTLWGQLVRLCCSQGLELWLSPKTIPHLQKIRLWEKLFELFRLSGDMSGT